MRYARLMFITLLILAVFPAWGAAEGFHARFAGQQTVDGRNALAVTFSKPLDGRQNLDAVVVLKTQGGKGVDGAWILAKDPQVVYFPQVEPDTAYRIEVAKGLRADDGEMLEKAVTYEVKTREAEPMIMFSGQGFVLASQLSRGLPVDSLNIPQADIDFFRIRPDKIMEFKNTFQSGEAFYYYQSQDLRKMADLVYSGRWDLDIKKDLRTQVNIPITQIRELKAPGIYFAVLKGAGLYEYGYPNTWFTISDLGVHARVYESEVRFFVQSLETAGPVAGARIQGVDKKGKPLFDLTTDDQGQARVAGNSKDLSLVTVTRGDHITLLPMDVPALDLSEFKTGTALFRPVELFVYGPRDIYRPGETVILEGLLRDQDGGPTPGLPIQARVLQPDGRMIREFTWKPGSQNHFHEAFSLPANALTGKWKVELSHGTGPLAPYPFLVSEFLPERMKLELTGGEEIVTAPAQTLSVGIHGEFLYGAPAAGGKTDARVHVKPARELFREQWPGYEFGDIKDLINTSFTTDESRLDGDGRNLLRIESQWQKITSPHWVTANVSLYDSGGRPVVRNQSWQVWPSSPLVGIRCLSGTDKKDPGQVTNDSVAQFEVMIADKDGQRLGAQGLEAVVIREHREYYWEYINGEWQWGSNANYYPVDRFSLDIEAGKTAKVSVPVEWGGYRLEIRDPATGLTSAYAIWAGWRPESQGQGEMNRPDRVDLTLDKPAYKGGDVARVTVKAPEGGKGFLFVDGGSNLLTLPVVIPAEGRVVDIPIDPQWQRHDLYLSALVIRPGESRTHALPKRAVGLIALPLDRRDRTLAVTVLGPAKAEPGRQLTIPVTVKDADGNVPETAWVTLAAVDLGILNLTGFKTPSPEDYFFRSRAYNVQLQDIYQKLIEANDGAYAKQRFGGDAPVLNRGGNRPATDVQILSIQKQAVKADAGGQAVFDLEIPEFDGSIRLMAVAHTERAFGSGDREMILASPLVVQAVMPRFLATGDQGEVVVDITNMTAEAQHLKVASAMTGPVGLENGSELALDLDKGARQTVRFKVRAGEVPGHATLTCRITGLKTADPETGAVKDRALERAWFIETRPPYPAVTRIWEKALAPGETFDLRQADLDGLVSGTIGIKAGLGSEPPLNLADHVASLLAYPYGCLEQTVSGLFPHVLLNQTQMADLGVVTGTGEETAKKIELGIQRLLEKQKSSGGFGLWESGGPESAWLTAYACHFFILAHNAGYPVPKTAVTQALKRLLAYVRQPDRIPYSDWVDKAAYRAAVRAYAAFALAKIQSLTLGDARSVAADVDKNGKGALALVQAGVALSLAGDSHLAVKSFDKAIRTARDENRFIGDYGSDIRDFAGAYYLLTTDFPKYKNRALFVHELNRLLAERRWLSTQERNALVMAGAARAAADGKAWQAAVSVGARETAMSGTQTGQAIFTGGTAANGFGVKNTGKTDLFVNLLLTGYPNQKPGAENHGVDITRTFLDINGKPVDISRMASGDRVIVQLAVTPEKRMPHALVVDLIPAGVELEDPNLSGAFIIDEIQVDGKLIRDWESETVITHREFRDDRFAAALELSGQETVKVFYGARVVSPGRFRVPAPMVEDMYRPDVRSVGRTPDWMTVDTP